MKIVENPSWVIYPTTRFDEAVTFFREVMHAEMLNQGVPVVDKNFTRFAQFKLNTGSILEVVEPKEAVREIFRAPIICIAVDHVALARREMESKGVAFVSETFQAPNGTGWAYFRDPSGSVFQIYGPTTQAD